MKKRRLLSLLLSSAIAVGSLPAMLATGAQASEAVVGENLIEGITNHTQSQVMEENSYLSLTLTELPEPEPEAVEITFAPGAGDASVGEGKLYYKNNALYSDAECTVAAIATDIPVINVITGEAGTLYKDAAWYNGDELVSDVLALTPDEAITLTAIAQPYYMVTFAFDEDSKGVSINYGESVKTETFNTDYLKVGTAFPTVEVSCEEGYEYSWDKEFPATVTGYVTYTIKGVESTATHDITLCTDKNLVSEDKQLIFVKSVTPLKYAGKAMIYSELHGAYVAEVDASLDKKAVDDLITESNEATPPTVTAYDTNGNSAITAGDAAYLNILLHEDKVNTLDLAARLACDANGDKIVTVTDCTQILKKSVGLI